ncbi:MAG: tRNA uridine 5-carboxymethylaminomethyl modification protein [Candidatus Neomarinimicrobiota bacterium]|nr:MAG: tRNA uridine 5-carboxymethylaminomethyl modification protein [Candidatus Neomarinimicrobiota bacterium]
MKYKKIFKPIRIGKVELRNRLIFPPISTNFADQNGKLTEKFVKHYVRRAKGGIGLIIVENVTIDYPDGKKGTYSPRFDSEEFLSDWKDFTKAIHEYDSKVSVELTHPGFIEKGIGVDDLSEKKILELINIYTKAALLAKKAGFDMVEIQGAHGLLVNQFLSPLTNHRTDRWGNRTLFPVEILKEIKKFCGDDFPVTIRLAVKDTEEGGITIEEGNVITDILAKAGYDMIQADIGIGPKEYRLEPISFPEGWRAYLAEAIYPKPVPIAAVGVIRSPEVAEHILENQADMVVLGRAYLADPDWLKKVKENKVNLIRKCIGCSECIKARHDKDTAICCGVNPNVGNEVEVKEAEVKKRIAIIGCGPAGLESALVSALRGHEVHIFCEKFGGQLHEAAAPPGKDKINWLIEFFENSIKDTKNITLHPKATSKDEVTKINPDAVIIATGSRPNIPFSIESEYIHTYDEILNRKVTVKNKNVIVCGGGLVGCETAHFLSEDNSVTIIEMLDDIAPGTETLSRKVLLQQLKENKVRILVKHKIEKVEGHKLIAEDLEEGNCKIFEFDELVFALGNEPYIPFKFEGVPSYVIGDAKKVRRIIDAIHEGFNIAIKL